MLTGCRWMDMPKEYGSHKTAWWRLKEWQERGVREELWRRLLELGYQEGRFELGGVAIDTITVEARKEGGSRGGQLPQAQGELCADGAYDTREIRHHL